DLKLLSFPLIVVHPYGVTIRALKLGVHVDEALHVILTRRQVAQTVDRSSLIRLVDNSGLTRNESFHVMTEEWSSSAANLQTWFAIVGPREHDINTPGYRLSMGSCRERNIKTEFRRRLLWKGRQQGEHQAEQHSTHGFLLHGSEDLFYRELL